ncbi:hypothetical protein J4526_01340 [Desulfurococcaceae archaeon MEX13E-LK6-19]|nr:hypothetical protein J4526_01340 [Desulfurococcaceae archaeon MEX13E-LK6-19]
MNKTIKKIKALSPVISVLLLVIIAAVASVMLYVWFSGYFASQAGKATTFNAISVTIKQATVIGGSSPVVSVAIAVQNLADEPVQVDPSNGITVTINGVTVASGLTAIPSSTVTIEPGKTVTILLTGTPQDANGNTITINSGDSVEISVLVQATGSSTSATYSDSVSTIVTAR